MLEIQWHKEVTSIDIAHKIKELRDHACNTTNFYKKSVEFATGIREVALNENPRLSEHDFNGAAQIIETAVEYCFIKMGRHTWFCDKEMYELLSTCKIEDDDLRDLYFPYVVFSLVFEKGIEINGFPLRSIRISTLKSKLSIDIIHEVLPGFIKRDDTIHFYFDFGENLKTGKCSHDTPPGESIRWHWYRPYYYEGGIDKCIKPDDNKLNTEELAAVHGAMKVANAALQYYSARPELISEYTLPRSQRYQHHGERKNYKRVMLPTTKKVHQPNEFVSDGGRTVAGHYRGWVLRTLRHERYSRNQDGSCKRILIQPTVVKGGPPTS
jgi:hypothetical protein